MKIRLAGVTEESCVDGPGLRFVVFVQGCPHACPGCHNPETWNTNGGSLMEIADLVEQIGRKASLIDGVTISGGEPFLQIEPCLELIRSIRDKYPQLSIMIYSGYTLEKLQATHPACEMLALCDILVDGPFIQEQKAELPFRGSANQRIIELKK